MTRNWRGQLLAKTVLAGVGSLAVVGGMAVASAQTAPQTAPAPAAKAADDKGDVVVVTGSIILRGNAESLSPLNVQTAEDIEKRGQTTISDVIQNLANNGAGNLPNNFTGNGAFAGGAVGASLRGLTTNSTLVLVDGLRMANYPLADDGTRNFVDLNTIPSGIIERVDVLKDGASSTYGADAIAGVINVITKKNFQGLQFKAEAGVSEHGGANSWTGNALFGKGDLATDGYNFYIGVEYEKDLPLYSRDRGYPYNTNDFTKLCGPSRNAAGSPGVDANGITCRPNANVNSFNANGFFVGVGSDVVATVRSSGATNAAASGDYRLIAPGCGNLTPVTVTPATARNTANTAALAGFAAPVTLCSQDFRHDYSLISAGDERFSTNARVTFDLNDHAQAYASGTYYQNDVAYNGAPSAIRATLTPGSAATSYSTANIALPPYVCPNGTINPATFTSSCSTVVAGVQTPIAGATLNPNNPYAAAGNYARVFYSFGDIPVSTRVFNSTFRGAAGVTGDFDAFGANYRYDANVTAMQTNLSITRKGYLFVPNLLNAIAQGTYNFAQPVTNTQAVRDSISPTNLQRSNSKLVLGQLNLSRDLFELPGGTAALGIGVSARYESLDNPSANDDIYGASARFTVLNPFGARGSRDVEAISAEVDLPFLTGLDVNLSARFDHYSSGQEHTSPKIGVRYSPFEWLTLRSTWSEGFRIASFAEANSVPTTGFITVNAGATCNAAHGGAGNAYCNGYGLGLTSISNGNLNPETSENFNAGFVLQPLQNWTFSADYFRIKKEAVIATGDYLPGLAAYYAGTPLPAGYAVVPDVPDINFPNAQPRAAYVKTPFQNLNQQTTDGYDVNLSGRYDLPMNITWTTTGEATYVVRLNQSGDGFAFHFAGTLGPYQTTSASGTPQLRFNWTNNFDIGPFSLAGTVYYTDGYEQTAEDNGGISGDCIGSIGTGTPKLYLDNATPIRCDVKSQTYFDLHGAFKLNDQLTFYADVKNLFDKDPAYDPTTYGGSNYNPAWGAEGILGRYFKVGVKANF